MTPATFPCPACAGVVAWSATSCPHCGYRPPQAPVVPKRLNVLAITLGIGAALIAVGSFLPWVAASSALLTVSRSGLDSGGDGVFTLAIGILLVLVALGNFSGVGISGGSRVLAFLGGFGALALAVYHIADVSNKLDTVNTAYVTGSVGMGLFVIAVGGAAAIVAAFGAPHKEGVA